MMQRLRYHLLDVFTREPGGGNPLAVFMDAVSIAPALMPRIARELNLSETVFVLPPTGAALARLRIFTPDMELPFAGHPTIGTACLLASLGARDRSAQGGGVPDGSSAAVSDVPSPSRRGDAMTLEELVGDVQVLVRAGDEHAPPWAQLTAAERPEVRAAPLREAQLASLLSVTAADIGTGDSHAPAPAAASCGVPFLFIPLRDRQALASCRLDLAEWQSNVAGSWAPHVFVYTMDVAGGGAADVHARMFAPAMGIAEDPATGAAGTALAALLALHAQRDGTHRWTMLQGADMGRPSTLELEADRRGGEVTACRIAGHSVITGVRELQLD